MTPDIQHPLILITNEVTYSDVDPRWNASAVYDVLELLNCYVREGKLYRQFYLLDESAG